MKYVIIGNSTAAVGCIEGIRSVDKSGSVTVVSDEPYAAYFRPLISYLLYGKTTEEKMRCRPADFYERNGVRTILGVKAEKIDGSAKTVLLSNGEELPFDRLLIAAGSRPFVPPMEGLDRVEKKFSFLKLDDAKALGAALTPKSRVLIIGAGLIGLKCAEGIRGRVASLTVVTSPTGFFRAFSMRRARKWCGNILRRRKSAFCSATALPVSTAISRT